MRADRWNPAMCAWAGAFALAMAWNFVFSSASARCESPGTHSPGPVDSTGPQTRDFSGEIDRALSASWTAARVEPADAADDSEFMRRVYLDLTGKIPSVERARKFLADGAPDKRERLVDELLNGAVYAAHFANTWREVLLAGTNPELRTSVPELESWLRLRFAANTPYDQLAAELIAASSVGPSRRARQTAATIPSPIAFFQANQRKPESLAASTSSVFLGVQVQCAQCHDHPFAKWRRTDFWSLAAFFRGVDQGVAATGDPMAVALVDSFDRSGLPIPGGKVTAAPRFLDGTEPTWTPELGNRAALAQWISRPDNPFFARAAVNRVWSQFFGRNLAPPPDSADSAPAGHAELLQELAGQFVASGYDLKKLVRAIVLSRAYQLSSKSRTLQGEQSIYFAIMPVRRMTADQLYDSLVQATGFYEPPASRSQQPFQNDSARVEFRNTFADETAEATETQTSIVQALAMMNGRLTNGATNVENSKTLSAVVGAPFLDTSGRLETLFLAAFSRRPSDEETAKFLAYAKSGHEDKRLADIFWALLNSTEFALNH
jgi:Protein of unknown function (DUF1549)/Protein of unknown function (DUF1553)